MILKAQKHEEVDVSLDEFGALLVRHDPTDLLSVHDMVRGEQDALRHEDLHDVHEHRVAVKFEADQVENVLLLLAQLILARVELALVLACQSLHGLVQPVLVQVVIEFLLLLCRLVAWKLSQELFAAGHCGIHFVVFGRNEEASQGLQHDQRLLHIFAFSLELQRQKLVQNRYTVIERFLTQP